MTAVDLIGNERNIQLHLSNTATVTDDEGSKTANTSNINGTLHTKINTANAKFGNKEMSGTNT